MDANQVANNLWIGGWSAARDHRSDFDVVVNVATDAPHNGDHHFNLVDGPGNDTDEFERAVSCVANSLRNGKCVLVHCVAGASRSLCVAAKAHSVVSGAPIDNVIETFRERRGCEKKRPFCPHDAMLALARAA